MLTKEYSIEGILFKSSFDGQTLGFEQWIDTDDSIYYQPLSVLVDNGFADVVADGCLVPYANIYQLNDMERLIIGVPPIYNKSIFLRADGMLNAQDLHYQISYLESAPDGDIIPFVRYENFLTNDTNEYLLSESQYELVTAIEQFNATNTEERKPESNFRAFAEIKRLAKKAGVVIDSYLANENVVAPDKMKIHIDRDEEGFTVMPEIDIEENGKFQDTFNKLRKAVDVYPIQRENGERVRVVVKPEQKEGLNAIKKSGEQHKSLSEMKKLVDKATEFFSPDAFDLSELYSDRVIEIGIYKPKFYPFVSPYKSCWIAGATVETPENGTTQIAIKNVEDLEQLFDAIHTAELDSNVNVTFNGTMIDIGDARHLAKIARKQLLQPDEPIEEKGVRVAKEVLIIEENAEKLGYAVEKKGVDKTNKYSLSINRYLKKDFRLKGYQEEGVAWLQYLYRNKASGCLIADDMGLGKTLQILYFIDWHSRAHPEHKPYLIVAPVSLLENWEAEYQRFFDSPRLTVNRLSSFDVLRKYSKALVDRMQKMDIILTSYEALRNGQLNFCAVQFDIVALDEAQRIKTPGTMVTNAAKALKSHFRIAMTGTPVENTLVDLWCIMDFCVPGLLGNAKAFASLYHHPLKNSDAEIEAMGNEIHQRLGIYFMRRMKSEVAKDLPEKHEVKEKVAMPVRQESSYQQELNDYITGIQPNILLTIMALREICDHPYLHDKSLHDRTEQDVVETSARLVATMRILEDINLRGDKVIVFAERKDTQTMLQRVCWKYFGVIPKIINGDTPSVGSLQSMNKRSRQSTIDEFQRKQGFNIIIMSPIAAGMGLNVTSANHVIHYSRHWNPAKEQQATDRAYRIGQEKDVYVYYPIAVSQKFKSFDETLDELLSRKSTLASSTIFPTERIEVNREELGNLLFGLTSQNV